MRVCITFFSIPLYFSHQKEHAKTPWTFSLFFIRLCETYCFLFCFLGGRQSSRGVIVPLGDNLSYKADCAMNIPFGEYNPNRFNPLPCSPFRIQPYVCSLCIRKSFPLWLSSWTERKIVFFGIKRFYVIFYFWAFIITWLFNVSLPKAFQLRVWKLNQFKIKRSWIWWKIECITFSGV